MPLLRRLSAPVGAFGLFALGGCTLSADLDSLTAGGPKLARTDAGVDAPCPTTECQANSESTRDSEATTSPRSTDGALSGSGPDPAPNGELSPATVDAGDAAPSPFEEAGSAAPSASPTTADDETPKDEPTSSPAPETHESAEAPSVDTSESTSPQNEPAGAALIHRYSFSDLATLVSDLVGDADGTVIGTASENEGSMVLSGGTYVELPTRVVDGLESVTVEVWFTSYGTRNWERVFDMGETEDDSPRSYLFLTSQTPSANGTMRATFRPLGESEVSANSAAPTSDDVKTHVAVVFDAANDQMSLYHDGELSAAVANAYSLLDMNVSSVWLGRSLFEGDPAFEGEFDELRIYDGALSSDRVRQSFEAGPDMVTP